MTLIRRLRSCRKFIALACVLGGALVSVGSAAQSRATPVQVDTVQHQPLVQTVDVFGRLVSRRSGVVAAQVSGAVVAVQAAIGDSIAIGDVIAEINIDELLALREVRDSELKGAETLVLTREAEADLAGQNAARIARLFESKTVTRAVFDDARQAQVIADARLAEAQSAVRSALANLRLSEVNLGKSRVLAPYSGIVIRRLTEIGSFVRAGDGIVEMVGSDGLEIEADVPVDRIAALQPGVLVNVLLADSQTGNDADNSALAATVRAVLPVENPRTRARAVRLGAELDGIASGRFAVGQTVLVQVPQGPVRDVLAVHKDAVVRRAAGAIVYVLEDEQANPRSVVLGNAIGQHFEVLAGIAAGDQVVIRGNERLRPGAAVRISQPGKPANGAPKRNGSQ